MKVLCQWRRTELKAPCLKNLYLLWCNKQKTWLMVASMSRGSFTHTWCWVWPVIPLNYASLLCSALSSVPIPHHYIPVYFLLNLISDFEMNTHTLVLTERCFIHCVKGTINTTISYLRRCLMGKKSQQSNKLSIEALQIKHHWRKFSSWLITFF